MSGPIINKLVEHITEQAAQQGHPQPLRQVDDQEQARFEQALNGKPSDDGSQPADAQQLGIHGVGGRPGLEGAQPQQEDPSQISSERLEPTQGEPADGSVGHALVKSIEDVKRTYDAQSQKIEEMVSDTEKQDMTPEELMKMQFEMMKMGMEVQFVGKGADKVSTDVQTLMNRSN